MFIAKLPEKTRTALVRVSQLPFPAPTYLAGGTATSLHLGHRLSDDIDLFTQQPFEPIVLVQALQAAGEFKLERTSWGTILGWLDGLRFSLFYYRYPLLYPFPRLGRMLVADLRDIAAMKVAAISDRGSRKDFIDLYFICKRYTLREVLRFYDRKYGALKANAVHIYKSLTYFDTAEEETMPAMLKPFQWGQAKNFFEQAMRQQISR